MRGIIVALLSCVTTASAFAQGSCIGVDCSTMQALRSLLETEGKHLSAQQYVVVRAADIDMQSRTGSRQVKVELQGGQRYAIIAGCGEGCAHAELKLMDVNTAVLAASPEHEAIVILAGDIPASGTYVIDISVPGCTADRCAGGFVVLRHGQIPAAATAQTAPVAPPAQPVIVIATREERLPASFAQYDNYDMLGGDLRTIKKISLKACADECRSDASCVAYSYDKWNQWCFPKSRASELLLTARSLTAVRSDQSAPEISKAEARFERFRGKAFPQRSQNYSRASSPEDCESTCAGEAKCMAFTYFKSSRECHRHEITGEYFPNKQADSGAKTQVPESN